MTIVLNIEPPNSPDLRSIDIMDQIRRMSDEEFFYFCQENPDTKFERDAEGNIISMAQTGGETGRRNTKLVSRLDIWSEDTNNGVVFDSSTGFRLPNGATRGPDAAWVTTDRWNALTPKERKQFPPLCPDFVVELLSESDTLKDTAEKMREYIDNGCRLGWMIDPRTEEVRIFRADGSISVLHGFDQMLSGEDVLQGFTFNLEVLR